MNSLAYETVATFAQQAGTLYFGAIFFAGVIWALWPGRKAVFDAAARLPLEDDEIDHG